MHKTVLFITVIMFFVQVINAQESKLTGNWLMTKAEVKGEVQEPFFITSFKEDGKMEVMGMDAGTWKYNSKNNSIEMVSDLDKDFNGESNVLTLNDKELIVSKDGAKLFYMKINMDKIEENNKLSDILETWKIKESEDKGINQIITFSLPDSFTLIEKESGPSATSTSTTSGTWMYLPEDKRLIVIGRTPLKGIYTIRSGNPEELMLTKNGETLIASKQETESNKIERLKFADEEFYTEDGDYKYYDDEQKLPWQNWDEKRISLINVHQLVYNYSSLISGTESFENKILVADVNATLEEEEFNIDYIFNGYDKTNLPEDAELPPNTDYSNILYPLNETIFRVAGMQQIIVPAGTFDCTVVEVSVDDELKKKLWMINDKPGIYARIIEDDPDETFGHYSIYELQEIK